MVVVVDDNERTFGNWNTADVLAQVLSRTACMDEAVHNNAKVNVLTYTQYTELEAPNWPTNTNLFLVNENSETVLFS